MNYTIAIPVSSIQKVLNYGLPSIASVSGGVSVANGAVSVTSLYPDLPDVPDLAYQQANNAYFQANTATSIAEAAFFYANTIGGGSAIDNVARVNAQSAYDGANTYFANTQNSIAFITGVNNTQNTVISLAYSRANTSINTVVGTSGSVITPNGQIILQSTNGVEMTGSGTSITINTPQALRTTDSPTFNSLTLSNPLSIAQGGTSATSAGAALTNLLPSGTTAGYVLTTGGPGTYYWAPGGTGGGGGATPGTTINSQRLSYIANGSGFSYTTPTYVPGASQLRVYFDGVRQFASTYTEASPTVVTFFTSPPSGVNMLIEVDGYINNPYYANNISFTAPFGSIPGSANTIQLAIQDIETRKATLDSPSFTGIATSPTPSFSTSNTQIATTGFVHTLVNTGVSSASFVNLTASGSVGIGTSSPGVKLDVVGTVRSATNSGTASRLSLFQTGVGAYSLDIPAGTNALTFNDSGTERMRITSAGNVGINTDPGLARFSVDGNSNFKRNAGTVPASLDAGEILSVFNVDSAYTADLRVVAIGAAPTASGSGLAASSGYIRSIGHLGVYTTSQEVARFNIDRTTNFAGNITAPNLGLGMQGQVWNNVTGSRAFNTQYTNSRTYPIAVSASTTCSGSSNIDMYVNGIRISFFSWQFNGCGSFGGGFIIVPPGATYQLNSGQGLQNWVELY